MKVCPVCKVVDTPPHEAWCIYGEESAFEQWVLRETDIDFMISLLLRYIRGGMGDMHPRYMLLRGAIKRHIDLLEED